MRFEVQFGKDAYRGPGLEQGSLGTFGIWKARCGMRHALLTELPVSIMVIPLRIPLFPRVYGNEQV
jgi:hypothetical protein